jgi:hypothetical protein
MHRPFGIRCQDFLRVPEMIINDLRSNRADEKYSCHLIRIGAREKFRKPMIHLSQIAPMTLGIVKYNPS